MHLALDRPLRATRLARARRCRLGLVREHGGNGDAQNNRHRHRYDEQPPDKDLIHTCHTQSVTPVSPSRCALTHARWGTSRSFRPANSIEPSRTRASERRLGLPPRVAARGQSATATPPDPQTKPRRQCGHCRCANAVMTVKLVGVSECLFREVGGGLARLGRPLGSGCGGCAWLWNWRPKCQSAVWRNLIDCFPS